MPNASKTFQLPDLGEVKLTKYKGSRHIRIRVHESSQVTVTLPYYSTYDEALNLVEHKKSWILENLQRTQVIKSIPIESFKTKFRELELIPCEVLKASKRISPTKIKVYFPETTPINDAELQTLIRAGIEDALRKEAKQYLPGRLAELATKHGLKYKQVRIKNTKTRWGSCSPENNVNLCSHLMKLPDELIDYVILHELAHIIEKNHSEKFWLLLSSFLGTDAKLFDKKLKFYRTSL